ncbi:Phospholipase A(1) DAD1, chloroplastic [Porphyridium purpureum]|uniref:Phospholipase A(1) DAD1, chloroplastic n=1 Tax=Porphyridium purpureum TaxID=35688 RepID=A0A5J4YSK6_PORPP|nr:Phospholipase A(1) DAD1, chloroplastic [Porphyridium purpureum]|eukprot:POR6658..scf236_6
MQDSNGAAAQNYGAQESDCADDESSHPARASPKRAAGPSVVVELLQLSAEEKANPAQSDAPNDSQLAAEARSVGNIPLAATSARGEDLESAAQAASPYDRRRRRESEGASGHTREKVSPRALFSSFRKSKQNMRAGAGPSPPITQSGEAGFSAPGAETGEDALRRERPLRNPKQLMRALPVFHVGVDLTEDWSSSSSTFSDNIHDESQFPEALFAKRDDDFRTASGLPGTAVPLGDVNVDSDFDVAVDPFAFPPLHRERSSFRSLRSDLLVVEHPKVRLEALASRHVQTALLLLLASVLVAGSLLIWKCVWANGAYSQSRAFPDGRALEVFLLPQWFAWFEVGIMLFCAVLLLFFGSLFLVRIAQAQSRIYEQTWVALVLVSFFFYACPIGDISDIGTQNSQLVLSPDTRYSDSHDLAYWYISLSEIVWSFAQLFFLWALAQRFRAFKSHLSWEFFARKLSVLVLLVVIKLLLLVWAYIQVTDQPLISFIYAYVRIPLGEVSSASGAIVGVVAFLDCSVWAVILWNSVLAGHVVARLDYSIHRRRQMSYALFLLLNSPTYASFFVFDCIAAFAFPSGYQYTEYVRAGTALLSPRSDRTSSVIVGTVYVLILVFFYSPASAPSLLSSLTWLPCANRNEAQRHAAEGVSGASPTGGNRNALSSPARMNYRYKVRELETRSIGEVLNIRPHDFILETVALMFNFCWIAYSYGKPGKKEWLPRDFGDVRFKKEAYLSEPEVDAHVLIFSATDRIVVSFKGTASLINLRSDISVHKRGLDRVFETSFLLADDHGGAGATRAKAERLELKAIAMSAAVHDGFATAYLGLRDRVRAEVLRLYQERRRAVFITGHSLGGAIATIFSLDLAKDVNREDIHVITFGGPRVGNDSFRRLYNRVISRHWRVVVAHDVVCKLPKLGYSHCGDCAFFTDQGRLFLDPAFFERNWFQSFSNSLQSHRKEAYELALFQWVQMEHQNENLAITLWPRLAREKKQRMQRRIAPPEPRAPFSGSFAGGLLSPRRSSAAANEESKQRLVHKASLKSRTASFLTNAESEPPGIMFASCDTQIGDDDDDLDLEIGAEAGIEAGVGPPQPRSFSAALFTRFATSIDTVNTTMGAEDGPPSQAMAWSPSARRLSLVPEFGLTSPRNSSVIARKRTHVMEGERGQTSQKTRFDQLEMLHPNPGFLGAGDRDPSVSGRRPGGGKVYGVDSVYGPSGGAGASGEGFLSPRHHGSVGDRRGSLATLASHASRDMSNSGI